MGRLTKAGVRCGATRHVAQPCRVVLLASPGECEWLFTVEFGIDGVSVCECRVLPRCVRSLCMRCRFQIRRFPVAVLVNNATNVPDPVVLHYVPWSSCLRRLQAEIAKL